MSRLTPVSHRVLIRRLHKLGFEGPYHGKKHPYMVKGAILITIPNPEREKEVESPRIVSKNKTRYRYCEICKKQGKKTIATWICIECSEKEQIEVLLCEDCLTNVHTDHYVDEIIY